MFIIHKGAAVVVTTALLAGCQSTAKYKPSAAECNMFAPIYWSRKDTLSTIQQVKTHNAVGKICGWQGK